MAAIKIIVAFALFFDLLWTLYWLLYLGLDDREMNRRIKDAEHPPPDELRNRVVITSQLVLMSLVNVMAGTVAGIAASLFVDGGRFRWPSSQVPFVLIIIAVLLTGFSGLAIAVYITRPALMWVWDTSDFRSYLQQVKGEGLVSEVGLAEIRQRRLKWDTRTNVRGLRNRDELGKLRLELPQAHKEWGVSSAPDDHIEFARQLRKDVTAKQVWRWILRKRLWRLGMPPFIAGWTLALIIVGRLAPILPRLPIVFPWLLFVVLALICTLLLYILTFQVGQLDLVVTNRLAALERKQLDDCDSLIKQIRELHKRQQEHASDASVDGGTDKLMFRIGRWDLCRRSNGTSGYQNWDRRRN
jgi:hypothetical protein